jgi:hypothetical protein
MIRSALVALTAATVLTTGTGVALADTPTSEAGSNAAVCGTRIPRILSRIDAVTARINGDATVKGSTAWLQEREREARDSGRTALADLIAARVANRPHRLSDLAHVKAQVQEVQTKDCAS